MSLTRVVYSPWSQSELGRSIEATFQELDQPPVYVDLRILKNAIPFTTGTVAWNVQDPRNVIVGVKGATETQFPLRAGVYRIRLAIKRSTASEAVFHVAKAVGSEPAQILATNTADAILQYEPIAGQWRYGVDLVVTFNEPATVHAGIVVATPQSSFPSGPDVARMLIEQVA